MSSPAAFGKKCIDLDRFIAVNGDQTGITVIQ